MFAAQTFFNNFSLNTTLWEDINQNASLSECQKYEFMAEQAGSGPIEQTSFAAVAQIGIIALSFISILREVFKLIVLLFIVIRV